MTDAQFSPLSRSAAYAKDTLLFAVLRYCGSCYDTSQDYDPTTGVYTDPEHFKKNLEHLMDWDSYCSFSVGGGGGEYKVVDANP